MSKILPFSIVLVLLFSFTAGFSQCNYSIVLYDTFGDGWQGGQVTVTVGTTPNGPYTLATGAGPVTYYFPVNNGDNISVTYVAGNWPQENEYYIYDANGTEIFHDGPGPIANNTPVGVASCPTCISPVNLNASGILLTSANLDWTSSGSLWNIEYGLSGFTLGTGTLISGINTNSYNLTGLTSSTEYSFYVQTDCGGSDLSIWSGPYTFTTACGTIDAPYFQNFENAGVIPNCWTNMTGDDFDWSFNTLTPSANTGPSGDHTSGTGYFAFTEGSNPNFPNKQADLTTPMINTSTLSVPGLSFWYNMYGAAMGELHVDIYDGTWHNDIFQISGDQGDIWNIVYLNISAYTSPVQVRFRGITGTNYSSDMAIDDVRFDEMPTCMSPSSLNAANISVTSADLSWNENGSATVWNIEYGPAGFTQGTGTLISGISTNPYTLTGLTVSTNYSFYVQADCGGGDFSTWTGPFTFNTLSCLPGDQCTFAMNMDDQGNSWNGAGITVFQNGVNMGFFTVTGGGTNHTTIDLCTGANIQLSWTSGTFDNETSFQMLDPSSNVIFSWSPNGAPSVGVFYSFISSCTPPTCPAPNNLTANNISDVSATLNWVEQGSATDWIIEYGPQGFTQGTGTIINTTAHPYVLNGLSANTNYNFYVQAVCGPGDSSYWAGPFSFTTFIGLISNPSVCGLQISIPDANCIDIPINVNGVSGTQLGTDVLLTDFRFIIKHTWDSDINATLESPNGVTITLTSNNGGNGDNFGIIDGTCTNYTNFNMTGVNGNITAGAAPFVGSYIPEGNMDNFNDNSNPNGTWILHVCDIQGADTGSVQFVQLVFDPIIPPATVVINELDCDQSGNDTMEFVELFDGGVGNYPLDGYTVVFYNGSNDQSYLSFDLDGYTTDNNGYFVIGNANVPGVSIIFADNLLENGADAVALYTDNASNFPAGTPLTLTNLTDALVYETNDPIDIQLLALLNPGQPQIDEDFYTNKDFVSCSRIPNGSGGLRNTVTYKPAVPTPNAINQVLPELAWQSTIFSEAFANDGSISNSIDLELNNLTFSSVGTFTDGIEYTIANVPSGLTAEINVITDSTATISLTGNALSHLNIDDVNNLSITFLDAAYNGLSSIYVIGNSKNNIVVDFMDSPPPTLIWDNNLFTETNLNDGSISDTIHVRLYSETFTIATGLMAPATHYIATNVPAGLAVQIEATSDTTAEITLQGNAINHNIINNIYNLSITFLDDIFTGGTASNVTDYNNDSLKIEYLDPFYQDLSIAMYPSDTIFICNNCPTCSPDIYILNNGPTTLLQNDSIIVYYIYDPLTSPIIDTVILNSDLLPSDSLLYQPALNISQLGVYSFEFYIYSDSDINNANDTAYSLIYAYNVNVDLGGINDTLIVTGYPHSLNAGTGTFPLSYLWSDNSTSQTISVTSDGWYSVTVTDIRGCTAYDSLYVIQNSEILDLSIEINPADTSYICNNCACDFPEFLIINNGPNSAYATDTIFITYIYPPLFAPVNDTIILNVDLLNGDTLIYNPNINILQLGIYDLQAFIFNSNDYYSNNDIANTIINAYEIFVDLGGTNDTLIVNNLPVSLDAGACSSPFGCNYVWSTIETTQTISVATESWYMVTVSDSHGCSAVDSVYIMLNPNKTDLSIEINPSDTIFICNNDPNNYPQILIINNGTNNLLENDSIVISYLYDTISSPVSQVYTLTADLYPSDTLFIIPDLIISQTGLYPLQAFLYNFNNLNETNDTAYSNIYAYNLTVDLSGSDTISVSDWPWALYAGNCTSPFNCSYLWSNGLTTNVIGIMADGWYSITVTDGRGCIANDSVYVYKPEGINEVSGLNGISVYPNPANNKVNIDVALLNKSEVIFTLYSINGQIINESKKSGNNIFHETIDISDVAPGIYYIRIASNENTRHVKLMVQ